MPRAAAHDGLLAPDLSSLALWLFFASLLLLPLKPVQAVSLLDMATSHQTEAIPLFNSHEFRYKTFQGIPYWPSVLKKSRPEISELNNCLTKVQSCKSHQHRAWRSFVLLHKHKPTKDKLIAVNNYFNQWPYKDDKETYGREDYWASLSEFLKNSGDCEDYAIAKYYTLRVMGFPEEKLRIVVLSDRLSRKGHAVLAVYGKAKITILDNQQKRIYDQNTVQNYKAIYSVNQSTRWIHVAKKS